MKKYQRYEPQKRTAIDDSVWWCVYDNKLQKWSTLLCFSKYKTKKSCQCEIDIALKNGWIKEA